MTGHVTMYPAAVVDGLIATDRATRRAPRSALLPEAGDREEMRINTEAIQFALDALSTGGGGTAVVPAGDYWVRTIRIPSNTTLHLSASSCLVAWPDVDDYERYNRHGEERLEAYHRNVFAGLALIIATDARRVGLTGPGTIDGNGFAFWDVSPREHVAAGGRADELGPVRHWEDDSPFRRERDERVSPLVEFDHCSDVVIRDLTVTDSPGWTIHPFCCDRVTIDGVTIDNYLYGPNTDGIDLNGCHDVVVHGCRVRSGDDAIIIKASADARSSERIAVSDCTLETHCAAVGIGAETVYPIREVTVTGVSVARALRMVQIELWEAGLVENVVITAMTGATMTDIPLERPIYVDIQHHRRSDGALGAVRNVQIHGVSAITRGRCLFTAADGATIEGLIVDGLQLTIPEIEDPMVSVPSSRSTQMSNDNPETRSARAAVVCDNVRRAVFRDVQIVWPRQVDDDPASGLRDSYDRGDLARDTRKREALREFPTMHAFLFRNASHVVVDSPHADGYRADRIVKIGACAVTDRGV